MELRHLRYFIAVAEELNYRRAAERLRVAAPPLSVQIKQLEQEIGARLFVREGRGIKLTEPGRLFLSQARMTLRQADHAVQLARRAAHGEVGQLTIGYNAPTEFLIFPEIIPAFRKRWPDIQLTFAFLQGPRQLDALRRLELDLGFLWLPVPGDEFDVTPLVEEPLEVALPADHALTARESIGIADLSREGLVISSRALAFETFHQIEQMFIDAGAVMNVSYELDNAFSIMNFVAMGCGCSIVPAYTRRIARGGVVFRPLNPPGVTRTLAVLKNRASNPVAETFYRFACERFHDLRPA